MAILELKDLHKSFGKNEVLKGISFSLEQGEVLSILGSSGGGKTTLLRCLNFLSHANSGTIAVNSEVIYDGALRDKFTDAQLRINRLHFGLVFQQFNLFPQYTALKNVTLAPNLHKVDTPEKVNETAKAILERVGLGDKMDFYPCELSGGQQQRVAIARALAMKPDILCFDEPTSALDPELTGEVLRVIRDLKNENRTMIIVTHEMEFARNVSDRIMFMADGLIEEMGTPDEIFNHPKSEKLKAFLRNSLESF